MHCNDRCYVAEEAQLLRGLSNSAEQTVQCLALPTLGEASFITLTSLHICLPRQNTATVNSIQSCQH